MPEVGLNGLLLEAPHSGTATYTRHLMHWLPVVAPDMDYRIFVRRSETQLGSMSGDRLVSPFGRLRRTDSAGTRADKLFWETVMLPLGALRRNQSLLHSLYFAAPILKPLPVVVTVHDMISLAVPGYHRSRWSAAYARLMARAVRGAQAVVTVSEHAKKDILRTLEVPSERVFVTPEAADERFSPAGNAEEAEEVTRRYHLPDRFLLYLGGAERRKNIETIVRAWKVIDPSMRRHGVKLVIVASFPPPDSLYPDIPGLVRDLGLSEDVLLVAGVDEADKPALYRQSMGFLFPSRYEGFGLTPLEAMASGLPVLCSGATSLPEVVGDAAWLLDPGEVGAWSSAMLEMVESGPLRAEMRRRSLTRSAMFSWRQTAEMTADVYRRVLGA